MSRSYQIHSKIILVCMVLILSGCAAAEETPSSDLPATDPATQASEPTQNPGTVAEEGTGTPPPAEAFLHDEPLTDRPGHVFDPVLQTTAPYAEYAYRSFIQTPIGMAWGPDGYLYVADWLGRHIVRISKDGQMEDLGLWKVLKDFVDDGPRSISFDSEGNLYVNDHGTAFRIDQDGTIHHIDVVLGSPVGTLAVSPSDDLYFTDRGMGVLRKVNPEGGFYGVLREMPGAENLLFTPDGTLYMTQLNYGDVLEVDLEGVTPEVEATSQVFAADLCGFDPCFLARDPEGDIWIRGISEQGVDRLSQFTPEGEEKSYVIDGEIYPGGPQAFGTTGGIAFDDEGGLWIASYNSRLVYLVPTSPGEPDPDFRLEVISPGLLTTGIAVDSQGVVYAWNANSGQLLKISQNQQIEILFEYLPDTPVTVAVDWQDVLYFGQIDGEILRMEKDGTLSHYVDLIADSLVAGRDGSLYAVAGKYGESRHVVKISDVDTYTTLVSEINGKPLGDSEILISLAGDHGLYLFSVSNRNLYYVDFDGEGRLIANFSELGGSDRGGGGPAAMAASPTSGEIYLTLHGPYSLMRVNPQDGSYQEVLFGIYADPTGMAVSQDGQWLYIGESGVIDKIPLDQIGNGEINE